MTRPTDHPSPLLPSALCLLMTRNLACTCLVSLNVPKSAQGELVKKTTLFVMAFALAGSLAMAQEKATPATAAPAATVPVKPQAQPADPVIITAGAITISKSEFER